MIADRSVVAWGDAGYGGDGSVVTWGSASYGIVNNEDSFVGTVFLTNARVTLKGSDDVIDFYAGTNNGAAASGVNEAFVFAAAAFGLGTISGFDASDTLWFNAADEGRLGMTQSNGNMLIALDGANAATLTNYLGGVSIGYRT